MLKCIQTIIRNTIHENMRMEAVSNMVTAMDTVTATDIHLLTKRRTKIHRIIIFNIIRMTKKRFKKQITIR